MFCISHLSTTWQENSIHSINIVGGFLCFAVKEIQVDKLSFSCFIIQVCLSLQNALVPTEDKLCIVLFDKAKMRKTENSQRKRGAFGILQPSATHPISLLRTCSDVVCSLPQKQEERSHPAGSRSFLEDTCLISRCSPSIREDAVKHLLFGKR